jgi:hypothetical protein
MLGREMAAALAADGWGYFRELRRLGHSTEELAVAIARDDLETFQQGLSRLMAGPDAVVPLVPFCIAGRLSPDGPDLEDEFGSVLYTPNMSVLAAAALHGAVRIARYLVVNAASITHLEGMAAITGGSHEIVRLLDDNSGVFPPSEAAAALQPFPRGGGSRAP